MNSPVTPPLRLTASCLGPVASLDATLSKRAQNMIYARNGTGKSFLTRALRYLDLNAQGHDVSDAAFNLVSEESVDSCGSFSLDQGTNKLGTLTLNFGARLVTANAHDRIFHVFSDEFVHSELRQQDFDPDGNIENEIELDHTNIDTRDVEQRLSAAQKKADTRRGDVQRLLDSKKLEELVGKALVRKQLQEYASLKIDGVLSVTHKPDLPKRSFKTIVGELDALKSIPAEPDLPNRIAPVALSKDRLSAARDAIQKITSPSTVSEDIKKLIGSNPDFFETGAHMFEQSGGEECPFCRQSVAHPPANDRINLYLAYFLDAEGQHKKDLRAALSDTKTLRENVKERIAAITRETLKFESLRKLIPSQKDVELPDFASLAQQIDVGFREYIKAIEEKGASPSHELSLPDVDVEALVAELDSQIGALNLIFNNISLAIRRSDEERKRLQREACAVFETEFIHSNWADIDAIYSLDREVDAAQAELDALKKSQLSASVKDRVADTFEMLIGTFFGNKYTFDRTEFILKRENKKMARGANRTLSDGEKTAIAFCYFIACAHKKVKSASDYAKLFLVFDDPITSMSYDFVFAIAQSLKNMSISSSGGISINPADIARGKRPDLLLFTHSSYFYNICITNHVVKEDAAFFLHKAGNVHKLSKRAQYIAPFELHLKEVVEVHNGREPDHTTGNAIRCILEAIGRFCHPDKGSLTDFITYLAGEGGFELKSVLINNLSHGTYYDETPSPDELAEACAEAIAIVDRYAKGQLEMVRVMSAATGA